MISTNDFKRGTKIEYKGEPYEVLDFQHVKMGRGGAFVRTKMKSLLSGKIIEETLPAGEKYPKPDLEEKEMQYLYNQGGEYYFMDLETYEQLPMTEEQLGDKKLFLKENMNVYILYYRGNPIAVELPNTVELQVVETDPGVKGDTASGGTKPAKLETGAVVKVPLHINEGDIIKVDTRTGEYVERAK
ncbi:MAG: elongation factor P [Nitrospirae bacterium]|nr:MAG: elongation factor P [Nitrospirota bacterium]